MTGVYLGLVAAVLGLALFDLLVVNRRGRTVSATKATAWALTYALLALLFNVGLFYVYEHHLFGLGLREDAKGFVHELSGLDAWQRFLAALTLQTALGLDSVFMAAAVFDYFRVPEESRRRVLLWGMPIALLVQWCIIWSLGQLFDFAWARIFIAVLLLLAAVRMLLIRSETPDPSKNLIVRLLRAVIPVSPSDSAGHSGLVTRVNGKVAITPLVIALVVYETADAFFALDGIPAVFAVTKEPLIVFAASAWSLLILRGVLASLATARGWIRSMKVALAMLLVFSAVLFVFPPFKGVPTGVILIVISTTLGAGLLVARLFVRQTASPDSATTSPLGADADELARKALRQARRVQILLVGSTIVLIGIFMLIGPGPGLLVIPIGLAMLATEFAWARQLLDKYSVHAQKALRVAGDLTVRNPRPERVPPVLGFAVGLAAGALLFAPYPTHWVFAVVTPILIFSGIWAWTTITKHREMTTGLTIGSSGKCPACMTDLASVPRDEQPFRCPVCKSRVRDADATPSKS
jgi:tellurite resistance protein TerC